ncbi:hypothetical protein RRG08_030950 [Elysia crispata]|uniref:Uncharacterized protein n=1 Tax=Elysia crispata TaxID=231223 RepID=A0AAE1AA69_9GAST|nr:hypothetical protein RRG08_030950 [Elysia crispata]
MSVEKVNPIPDDSKDFEKSRATIAFSDFASKLMDLYCYVSLGKITWSDTQLKRTVKCESSCLLFSGLSCGIKFKMTVTVSRGPLRGSRGTVEL